MSLPICHCASCRPSFNALFPESVLPSIHALRRVPHAGAPQSLVYYAGFRGCAPIVTGEREVILAYAKLCDADLDWDHMHVWALDSQGRRVVIK